MLTPLLPLMALLAAAPPLPAPAPLPAGILAPATEPSAPTSLEIQALPQAAPQDIQLVGPPSPEREETSSQPIAPASGQGEAPLLELDPLPPPPAKAAEVDADAPLPALAHGVVLRLEGKEIVLIGDQGLIHNYPMPGRVDVIDISDGSLAHPEDISPGAFLARVGEDAASGRILHAYLPMGTQPIARYESLIPSIEGSYQAAIRHMEKGKATPQ